MRELHSRVNDGIHIRLLWCEHDGRLSVAVTDTRSCEAFSIEIRDGEDALDVFNHPFAYAAWHGIKTPARRLVDEPAESLAA
ncbi:MAG: hypothetical protein ABSG43_00725 [Solirubrobacteraceae bacterium]|jgi:hypothetical protein